MALLTESHHLDWETAVPKEALMAAAMEFSGYAIIGWTAEGTIFSWNPGAETLYGYSAAEALGEFITLIVPAERRADVSNILQRIAQGGTVEDYETAPVRKD